MNAKEKISASSTFAAQYPELGTGPVGTDVYCDPAFYERELAAIFRRTWLCVGRVEQAVDRLALIGGRRGFRCSHLLAPAFAIAGRVRLRLLLRAAEPLE